MNKKRRREDHFIRKIHVFDQNDLHTRVSTHTTVTGVEISGKLVHEESQGGREGTALNRVYVRT